MGYGITWVWGAQLISQAQFFLLASVAILGFYVWYSKRHFYALASKITGPPTIPLVGNALDFYGVDNAGLIQKLENLIGDYGPTVRVWLGHRLLILITDPRDIEISLNSNKLIDKDEIYTFFDDMLGQGLFNASGEIWKKHRRIIAPTFHNSVLKHFVPIFDQQSQRLITRLKRNVGQSINVFPLIRDCSLDFISETAMESTIDAQGDKVSEPTLAAERMMHITFDRVFKIWLHADQIFFLTKTGREYLKLREIVRNTTEPILKAKKEEIAAQVAKQAKTGEEDISSKRKSFFRLLVGLNESGENFNFKELRDEVMTIIITGYETTAATVSFILVMLGIHQDVQERVYEEVKSIEKLLDGRELEAQDLNHFTYTDMVIKETLRLYPVGPFISRKATADIPLATCTVPKGASVSMLFFHAHRNPQLWKRPMQFNPDNFLPEEVAKRHPYSYNPFSAGPRGCIGQKYAQMSMRVMLYHIVSNFRIYSERKMEDIGVKIEVTLKMIDGFNIRLERRK